MFKVEIAEWGVVGREEGDTQPEVWGPQFVFKCAVDVIDGCCARTENGNLYLLHIKALLVWMSVRYGMVSITGTVGIVPGRLVCR